MSYLARLKLLDSEKNFTHIPETVLTKPTEGAFVSYGSTFQGHIEKINAANDAEIITPTTIAMMESCVPLDIDFAPEADVDRSIGIAEPSDDRRYCTQCRNLHGRVCTIAYPGGLVSANRGYRPQADTLLRCAGYFPNATDNDQRPGDERWPGLTDTKGTK